jgi:uncharacterized protein (TIRG00374 family)
MAADRDSDAASGSGPEFDAQIAAPARFGSLRRQVLSLPVLVSFLVAGGFLLFMVTRFDVDLGITWGQARGANPWLLAAAFAVHYTTFVFRGARWRLLLAHSADTSGEAEPIPSVMFCSRAVLLGWFINSIGWLRLGDAYRAYLYREEHNAAFSGAIGTVLAERVLDVVLVVLMLLAAAPFLISHSGGGAAWAWVTLTAVLLVLLLVIVLALLLRLRTLLLRWLPDWLASRYERFLYGATAVRYKLPQTTLLGLLGWAAEMGRMYLVAMALGFDLSVAMVVFLTLANSLLSLVPTPGGIGAVEPGVAGLAVRLAALGKEAASALVLVDRFITYVSVIIVGAALFAARPLFRRRPSPSSIQSTPSP